MRAERGWTDNAFGGVGPVVYFASRGAHTVRVQLREDGLSIDQIILSVQAYINTSPARREMTLSSCRNPMASRHVES